MVEALLVCAKNSKEVRVAGVESVMGLSVIGNEVKETQGARPYGALQAFIRIFGFYFQ